MVVVLDQTVRRPVILEDLVVVAGILVRPVLVHRNRVTRVVLELVVILVVAAAGPEVLVVLRRVIVNLGSVVLV